MINGNPRGMSKVVNIGTRTIAHGPNAGQPQCSADLILDGMRAAKDVIAKLKRNGFIVIKASADKRQATVQVMPHPRCAEMVAANQAGYFLYNATERHGEFFGEANDGTRVRIIWIERGN